MKSFLKQIEAVLLLTLLVILPQLTIAGENTGIAITADNKVSWSDLTFTGSKFLTSLKVQIQLESIAASADIHSSPKDIDLADCPDTDYDHMLLTLKSTSKGIGPEYMYEERVWIKNTDGLPYKRIRLSKGDDLWVKSYCWEEKGVRRYKIAPGSPAENKRSPAAWSDRTESFYEYPEDLAGCGPISDPALIFQIVSSLDPVSRQDPFEICVFGKKQLHRLTIRQEKSTPLKVSYSTRSASHEAAVEEEISPVVYAITTENISNKNREPESFSLLGLHKDIRIYLEPDKLIPVSISGTNNSVGKLYLLLQHAELNR